MQTAEENRKSLKLTKLGTRDQNNSFRFDDIVIFIY